MTLGTAHLGAFIERDPLVFAIPAVRIALQGSRGRHARQNRPF